ncbi:MAG: TAXI family TRAP transporter solute-binding subunit, partial [Alphaproteobacteria bacterium]|nr:TAXI family TRAP transporter solute-binding subunit [Alphaproteobacteria bacterium]
MTLALMVGGWQAQAQGKASFVVAIDAAGTDSFVFGTELWAVSQIELLPRHRFGLETVEVRSSEDRLRRLDDGQVDFALVRDDVSISFARHLRAVMALWPNGVTRVGAEPTHLLVNRNVSDDVVYQITRTILEHAEKLRGAHSTIGIGSPSDATTGLVLPIHPGTQQYYKDRGLSSDRDPALTSHRPKAIQSYGAIDHSKLANDELLQLKAACEDASKREVLDDVDGDELIEICSIVGAVATGVRPMGLSHG